MLCINDFKNSKEFIELTKQFDTLSIADVNVRNPNNPAQLLNCKKITFYF